MNNIVRAIEENTSLYRPTNFNGRADAIDFLEFHIIDRVEGLLHGGEHRQELGHLQQYAKEVKDGLEKVDADIFERLRENISTGTYTDSAFRATIDTYLTGIDPAIGGGYDNRDIFINGLLSPQHMLSMPQPLPEATKERTPEMVFYQKTPARIIFELTEMAQLQKDDVFFDIGSGLGQAAILVNLLTGTPSRGIEYERAYCHYAKACATALNLSNVTFINEEALDADYSRGTVFFLYTPFKGQLLQDMLAILHKESQKRMIRVFTYGPCSPQVALQHWLTCVNGDADNPCKLCEFRPRP